MKKKQIAKRLEQLELNLTALAASDRKQRRAPRVVTKPEPFKVSDSALVRAKAKPQPSVQPFALPKFPPNVVPKGSGIAMDEVPALAWASGQLGEGYFTEGLGFLGYTYLSELAQRPEYRVISETIASEMTRKWVKVQAKGEEDKSDKIGRLVEAMERLKVRDSFRELIETDGLMGRSHLYIDLGATDDPAELKTPIGNGHDSAAKSKVAKGSLQSLRTVEPVWCYPTGYNSTDPLHADWYRPSHWFAMGKQIHGSRLLTIIGREVPDLLKPAYAFGGLSMSQMAKPYVDNWIRTRQSISDIIHSFVVYVLKSNLSVGLQADGDELFRRADLFNELRDNRGLMLLDKDSEEFQNIQTSLASLDALQAQSQEHMAAVSRIPLVKLTGISPTGLNASSDGEIRVFYDTIHSQQRKILDDPLKRVLGFIQLSEFGEVDPDITYAWEPLWSLDEKATSERRKTEAETAQVLIDTGVISPQEERNRIANDPETPYQGLDQDDAPDLLDEEEEGLEPKDGAAKLAVEDGEREPV